MGGLPKGADSKKAVGALVRRYGWEYDTNVGKSAHPAGVLRCGKGCRVVVYSTGRGSARAIWGEARRCRHGHAPSTHKPPG